MAKAKLAPIKSGTVIDHIGAGFSLHVLNNLGIGVSYHGIVGILMNVPSQRFPRKDVIKIENYNLSKNEIYKVAVVAPHATISFIKNYKVSRKVHIQTLEEIALACSNLDCRSNSSDKDKPVPIFKRLPGGIYVCKYCLRNSYTL